MGTKLWQYFIKWCANDSNEQISKLPSLAEQVEHARRDWGYCENFFNNVLDQELVDYAVHALNTAERRYIYLLKQARREGVTQPFPRIEYYVIRH